MSNIGVLRLCLWGYNNIHKINRYNRGCVITNHFSLAKSKETDSIIDKEPIKYSKSGAYQYKAKTTRTGTLAQRLWYEPYVIMASLSVFLLYFTIIREENDIDEELSRSLYSRISGLEEHQLRLSLEYNQQHGLQTEDIMKRLTLIEKTK